VNVTIKVKFNEPLNISTLKVTLTSDVEGEIQVPKPDYDPLGHLTLKPFLNLTHSRNYTVKITAKDLSGNPLVDGTWTFTTQQRPEDFDNDKIPDSWEMEHSLNPDQDYDALEDTDNDGLINLLEYNKGFRSTDPRNPDTDDDQLPDGWERDYGLDPLSSIGDNGTDGDPDNDGFTNYQEYKDGTNPKEPIKIPDKGNGGSTEEDISFLYWLIPIIIIVIVFIILIARKVKYTNTGFETKDDDDYLKTNNSSELGVGGDLLFTDSDEFKAKKNLHVETERSIAVGKTADATKGKSSVSKPTPQEMLTRAKSKDKKCPKCGAELPMDTNYCFECGNLFS